MPILALDDLQSTGYMVSDALFGANMVFETSLDGLPTAAYADAARVLGVQNIRFGGGQADLDPTRANAEGETPIDGLTAINIVTMPGGALRPELVRFLDWAAARTAAGEPVQATLVIPTKHLSTADYAAFGTEISGFVAAVMQQYGPLVSAFQIGNEYWEMGETAYGQKASIAAEAIAEGLARAGIAEPAQPAILVQMATAGNNGSEFGPGLAEGSFGARNAAANAHIIAQLSDAARAAIDGVTEHYYYNQSGIALPTDGSDLRHIDRDYAVWEAAFDKELDFHITEWNIRTTATEMQGMVAASTLVHQFANMVAMGVDSAHVWTLDYHSRTALTLDSDGGPRLDAHGRLLNSPQGAVFDLMSEMLPGKTLMQASFSSGVPGIAVSAYASATEATLFISSRSWERASFTFDAGPALGGRAPVAAVQISLDPASVNGRQWAMGAPADSVMLDGRPYYYNEHDADVRLTDLVFDNAGQVALTLDPFDVVALTFDLSPDAPAPAPAPALPPEPAPAPLPVPLPPQTEGRLLLQPGMTQVTGSAGIDSLEVGLARDAVELLFNGYGWAELYGGALGAPVTLSGVERLVFEDGLLALDTFGVAGEAYRLYQASFDRTPDAPGLAFWIGHLDRGAISLQDAAEAFLASPEFAGTYGENSTLQDAAFLDLLYLNVLDRLPDAPGYAFWQDQQAAGLSRAEMLVFFSESTENRANVAGQIEDGIWFGF